MAKQLVAHRVYYREEDGVSLCASFTTPWFCVAGRNQEDAAQKGVRALEFFARNRDAQPREKVSRVVEAFAPTESEDLLVNA